MNDKKWLVRSSINPFLLMGAWFVIGFCLGFLAGRL